MSSKNPLKNALNKSSKKSSDISTFANQFLGKKKPYFYVASVISYAVGFILYNIYIVTKGERAWQIATFVCFIVSIFPYFVFWQSNPTLQVTENFSFARNNLYDGFMGLIGMVTLGFAIYNWYNNNDKIESIKQDLPDRYWKAEALFSLFLFGQVLATGYYFFVKKMITNKKDISPLLWSGMVTIAFLLANAMTAEIWNISTNFITAG